MSKETSKEVMEKANFVLAKGSFVKGVIQGLLVSAPHGMNSNILEDVNMFFSGAKSCAHSCISQYEGDDEGAE